MSSGGMEKDQWYEIGQKIHALTHLPLVTQWLP